MSKTPPPPPVPPLRGVRRHERRPLLLYLGEHLERTIGDLQHIQRQLDQLGMTGEFPVGVAGAVGLLESLQEAVTEELLTPAEVASGD